THTGGGTITTPVATIGIRGGILTASHSGGQGTQVILGFGTLTMSSGGTTRTVARPGFMVQTQSAGSAPSEPTKVTMAQLDQSNGQLTSKSGQTGGSSSRPTDQQAASNNIGTSTSVAIPLVIVNQAQAKASGFATFGQSTQQAAQQGT